MQTNSYFKSVIDLLNVLSNNTKIIRQDDYALFWALLDNYLTVNDYCYWQYDSGQDMPKKVKALSALTTLLHNSSKVDLASDNIACAKKFIAILS